MPQEFWYFSIYWNVAGRSKTSFNTHESKNIYIRIHIIAHTWSELVHEHGHHIMVPRGIHKPMGRDLLTENRHLTFTRLLGSTIAIENL